MCFSVFCFSTSPDVIMITPAFELSQDADFLTIVIRVPYTRTSEFDIYIQGEDFKFYAKPYFLRWLTYKCHGNILAVPDIRCLQHFLLKTETQKNIRAAHPHLNTLHFKLSDTQRSSKKQFWNNLCFLVANAYCIIIYTYIWRYIWCFYLYHY